MANPQIEIVVFKDGKDLFRRMLPTGEYILGSEKDASIVLEAPRVAGRHARLKIEERAVFVEDLGSEAGTLINGRPVRDITRVWPSQKVHLGDAALQMHLIGNALPDEGELVPKEVVVEHTYEIEKVLLRKDEGAILDTHDSAIRRDVAMKILRLGASEEEAARFVEEAQITGQLEHPGIPPIHELGADEHGRPYFTMKVVRGVTLAKALELLHAGQTEALAKFPLCTLLGILKKVCEAVAFAHSRGIVHCNLRPDDITIGEHGEVLVMEWGHALILTAGGAPISPVVPPVHVGCAQYIAPEQARGESAAIDARTDIYALGAILYHILALRSPISTDDPAVALQQISEGRTDQLDLGQRYPHLPRERVPDPLAAIVAKAMARQPSDRYQNVEALQADLGAYQNATITEAEKVGPVRQFFFVVRRYKAVSLAAAIVVGSSLFFGTTAVIAALRAHRQSVRDQAVVTNLRSKAAEFLRLAEHEADTQRFENALASIEASLAVDPTPSRPYWERAWALLALERWDEAANALRAAQEHGLAATDAARGAAIAAKMKAISKDPQRWKNEAAHDLLRLLESSGASGPAFAIAAKLQENAEGRRKLVEQRLLALLGKDRFSVTASKDGQVTVNISGQPLRTLDALRGLPIDNLDASGTAIFDLEALRGARLQTLDLSNTKIASLTALQGLPLRRLVLDNTAVRDLAPLKGMSLETVSLEGTKVYDFSVFKGMPLRELNLKNTVMTNLTAIQGIPLETLNLSGTFVSDLSPLKGAPLKTLDVRGCKKLTDLHPLLAFPSLERLSCDVMPKELSALRQSKSLQMIEADVAPGEGYQGARPAASFWADFDAKNSARTQ